MQGNTATAGVDDFHCELFKDAIIQDRRVEFNRACGGRAGARVVVRSWCSDAGLIVNISKEIH